MKKNKVKTTVHFRFKTEMNELLAAASEYLGITKTELVEECIRLNLHKAIKDGEIKKSLVAEKFKKLLANTEL